MNNLIQELQWRGLTQDIMPDTESYLMEHKPPGYIGFDPTADSLHVGSMVQIVLLKHMQMAGHKPYALVGGATGMVGDPSGKSDERNLQTMDQIDANVKGIKSQLEQFLDFDGSFGAEIVNNYDWMKDFSFLDFIRDVGKHITVNYMSAKDSVKSRLETGMSFTEFSYQLLQGYDFLHLYREKGVRFQCGGSDQWGNITTGTELIRRIDQGKAFAFTSPLITKADGGKFGKSEDGNVWLDPEKTSPYKFYQFWINVSDEDALNFIKIFSFKSREEIGSLIAEHQEAPHIRLLQNNLAEELTCTVHSKELYDSAVAASSILFGKSTKEQLLTLNENQLLDVFEGVPQHSVSNDALSNGIPVIDFLSEATGILSSKGEARRALKENAISINKEKVKEDLIIDPAHLINGKYILAQKGKKNYYLIKAGS